MQILTPKLDFIRGDKQVVNAWFEQCASPALRAIIYTALAEFAIHQEAALATDAAAAYYRIEGARRFAYLLLNLAEESKPLTQPVDKKLNVT